MLAIYVYMYDVVSAAIHALRPNSAVDLSVHELFDLMWGLWPGSSQHGTRVQHRPIKQFFLNQDRIESGGGMATFSNQMHNTSD